MKAFPGVYLGMDLDELGNNVPLDGRGSSSSQCFFLREELGFERDQAQWLYGGRTTSSGYELNIEYGIYRGKLLYIFARFDDALFSERVEAVRLALARRYGRPQQLRFSFRNFMTGKRHKVIAWTWSERRDVVVAFINDTYGGGTSICYAARSLLSQYNAERRGRLKNRGDSMLE